MPSASNILKKLKKMKTLPNVGIRLTRMISEDTNSLQEFEEIIRLDPTLVLRLLKTVNSTYYALSTNVKTIPEAVAYAGMDNLRNMIVTDILKNLYEESTAKTTFSRNNLWLHSAAVAICSQMVCERVFEINGENAFLTGIFHDIGMIIEDQVVPDRFSQACDLYAQEGTPIDDCERQVIGTDHTEIGFLLSKDWCLPEDAQESIQGHHKLKDIDPQSPTGIIKISEYLVSQLNYCALPDMKSILSDSLLMHMRESIKEYKAIIADLPDELKKANDIFSLN